MSIAIFLVGALFALFTLWSLAGVLYAKGKRKRKLKLAGIGFLALVACLVGLAVSIDRDARQEGFLSAADKTNAKNAGVSDPKVWAAQRKEAESAAAAGRAQKLRAEEEKKAEAKRAAELAAATAEAERQKEAEARKADEEAAAKTKEEACRQDLQCWGDKGFVAASVKCPRYIERMAKFDYEWTDGVLETKLSHLRWLNKEKGSITYIGGKIKMQNGFGAWAPMIYECDFDPVKESVLDVRLRQGRL